MREYATPLAERLRISRIHKERVQRDPEYRLRCLNRSRIARGLKPRASVEEILAPEDVKKVLREFAAKQRRDENGRFQP